MHSCQITRSKVYVDIWTVKSYPLIVKRQNIIKSKGYRAYLAVMASEQELTINTEDYIKGFDS